MQKNVRYLIALGYTFREIADACGLDLMLVYACYLGRHESPVIDRARRHYDHTGRLPGPCQEGRAA